MVQVIDLVKFLPFYQTFFLAFYADVQVWLKSLRLHKYSELFMGMTYDEMMELTAEKLGEKVRNEVI